MRSWWTKLALDNFEERTKCFIQQYSSYSLDGQNENGQRTLSNYFYLKFICQTGVRHSTVEMKPVPVSPTYMNR